MARMVAFSVSEAEKAEIDAYCSARHFKNVPDFARVAIFAYIRQNRPGGHRKGEDTAEGGKASQ